MSLPAALPEPTEDTTAEREEHSHVRRRDLLGMRPEDPRRVIDSAIGLHMLGDHQQALEQLEPLTLQLDAIGAEALFVSALCHAAQNDPLSAIGCLEVALLEISIDELSRIAVLYEIGTLSESLGDHRRAREAFRAIHARAPWFRDTASHAYRLGA